MCRSLCVLYSILQDLVQSCLRGEGGDIGGHVLRETTSRGRWGLVCPSRNSERGGEREMCVFITAGPIIKLCAGHGTREEPGTLTQGGALFSLVPLVFEPKTPGCLVQTTSPSGI